MGITLGYTPTRTTGLHWASGILGRTCQLPASRPVETAALTRQLGNCLYLTLSSTVRVCEKGGTMSIEIF